MSLRKFLLALLFFWPTAANAGELTDADNLTAHDFEFKAIDGGRLALSQFAGKVILVVNTASRCGFAGSRHNATVLRLRARGTRK